MGIHIYFSLKGGQSWGGSGRELIKITKKRGGRRRRKEKKFVIIWPVNKRKIVVK